MIYDVQLAGAPADLYERISDDREGKRLGVKRQDQDNRALAARLGMHVRDTYVDNDISAGPASKKYRQRFRDMMQAVRDGQVKVVLAYSTSRVTRRPEEGEEIITAARDYGVKFIYVASPYYDLTTADGRESYRRDVARDVGEVDRLQERIARKKLEDAREGKYPGGRRTYGLGQVIGVDPKTGKEVRDWTKLVEAEVNVIREVADRLLAGQSQLLIVQSLNQRGIPTTKDTGWKIGKLKRTVMNESYVTFDDDTHPSDCPCLKNPQGNGTRIHGSDRHRAEWPGIFTAAEHGVLANYFNANPFSWQQGQTIARRYMLTGITFCGTCGAAMTGQKKVYRTKQGYVSQRRYHCKKYSTSGEQVGCNKVFRIADPVDKLVSDAVLMRFDSPEVAEALAPTADRERARELTQVLITLNSRKLDLAREHALTPYEDYGVMLGVIKSRMDATKVELDNLRTVAAKKAAVEALGDLRARWDSASLEWRSSVVRLLVKRVVIYPGRSGGKLYEGWRFDPDLVQVDWSD